MKKSFAVLLVVSLLAVMAGCAVNTTTNASESSTSKTSEQLSTTSLAIDSPSEYIGEDAAKAAALEHSGMIESEVTYIKSQLDYDDGRWLYDVEFYYGNTEYDYEIDASTGEIISYDFDIEEYTMTSSALIEDGEGTYIGLDEAKSIALNKTNLTKDQVIYTEASFEYDDGIAVYQIDFVSDGIEYELEINATTGDIIEYGAESQYD